jgi:hypothetical protein
MNARNWSVCPKAAPTIHQPPGSIGKPLVVDTGQQHPLPAENTLSRNLAPMSVSECCGYGTTHVIFDPLDFIARLAALIPRPRANLTRFHGVFAPNSKHRALVTPSKRGKSAKRQINGDERSPVEQHAAMTWAQRLKRVFNIDIAVCKECGGIVKVIASIEDPAVIKQILAHLERKAESKEFNPLPESRAPPQIDLFG